MSEKLEDKAVEVLDKLENLLSEYSPQVADAAIEAVRVTGVGDLIFGLVAVMGAIGSFYIFKLFAHSAKAYNEDEEFLSFARMIYFAIAGVIVLLISVLNISNLFDIWVWVSIFNPELALAHKITGL